MLDGQCPLCHTPEGLSFLRKWRRIWRKGYRYAARWVCPDCDFAWWSVQPALTTRALEECNMLPPDGMEFRGPDFYGANFPRTYHLGDAA